MGDCSSLQRWGVHIVSAPNPVGKPPPTFCLKTEHLDPPVTTIILFEINRFAPPSAIWFCVVASFNSDFEINYLFWSDRTGWFVYRRLGASNLEFNNPQNLQLKQVLVQSSIQHKQVQDNMDSFIREST